MRNKVVAVLLSVLFLILLLPAPSTRADGFDVGTLRERYAILVDANDPTTALYGIEKNADAKCSTGSTIKILTCMLAIESDRLDEEATVSDNAVNFNKKYNSLMGIEAGEKWAIQDLLYGLMLPSGNDAAIAIAEHLAGSTKAFANKMNEKAQELGMTHSHFTTVHGKDDGKADNPKNYSTATLYVPKGTKEKYQSTASWTLFTNIVEEEVTAIDRILLGQQGSITVYDTKGRKINPSQMRKGHVYIVNGKKVVKTR